MRDDKTNTYRINVICRVWATPNQKNRFTYLKSYATFPKHFVQKTGLIRPELKLNSSLKSQYTHSYKLDREILKIWLVQNLSNQPVQWRARLKSLSKSFILHWPKGQKILKAIYGVLNSSKKWMKKGNMPRIVIFGSFFRKNWGHHEMLSRLNDL